MAVMTANPGSIKVRMYRHGLGDCFLLAFGQEDGKQCYMVIDCGIFYGTPSGSKTMVEVAESIQKSTGGRIDVLTITHEHYDHLSGFRFKDARKVWDQIEIGQVWAAWTEDPKDEFASALKGSRARQEAALHFASDRLRAAGNEEASDHINGLLGFSSGVRKDLEYVLSRVGQPTFLRPGTQAKATKSLGVPGVRCYVMGPPRDKDTTLLKRSNPSKSNSEVYEHAFGARSSMYFGVDSFLAESVLAAASRTELNAAEKKLGFTIERGPEFSNPFESDYAVPVNEAKKDPFFKKRYGFTKRKSDGDPWRRIGGEWLGGASALAMQLDNAVNNTSLVLAFEIEDSGKVLLFPGDAQVGNMLSWHQHEWDVDGKTVTAEDLLDRTSFYKCGHHGSHNATLKELGLELMNGSEFTAFIPVSKEMAARQGKKGPDGKRVGWKMPYAPLLEALKRKSDCRVIQADDGLPTEKPKEMTKASWDAFKARSNQTKLYVEVEL